MLIVKFTKYIYLKNSLLFKYRTRYLISFVCIFCSCPHPILSTTSPLSAVIPCIPFQNQKLDMNIWFKNYWRQNLLIPSVPRRRTAEVVQQGTPLTAVANNNLYLFPHVPFQFFSDVFLSPDVLWTSLLFFFCNLDTIHKNQYKSQQDIYISVSISLYFIQDHMSLNLLPSCL